MVLKRLDDAFMALLRSYHSQRFCRAALSARNGVVVAPRYSTKASFAAERRTRKQNPAPPPKPQSKPTQARPTSSYEVQAPKQVAVIGAGITGLTTAHYLAKWLPETSHITIYDAANRVGGWIDTQTVNVDVDGQKSRVRFERGPRTLRGMGKDTWKFDDLVLWDLLRDLDMIKDYRGQKSPPRYLYYPDHLVNMSPLNALHEPVFKGAIPGLLTAMVRRYKARGQPHPPDMSVSDFVKFATGRPEMTDNMVSAMIHGIWGGDADKLSMRSFMPAQWWRFFYKPRSANESSSADDRLTMLRQELGLLNSLGTDEQLTALLQHTQKDQLVVFKDGMSSLPNAIERDLRKRQNVTFKLGDPVTDLRYNQRLNKVSITSSTSQSPVFFDKVISTTTSNALYNITSGALPSLAQSPNVSIMAVNVWYPDPKLNKKSPGVGYLVPRSVEDNLEGLLGVFFDSDVLPRAEGEPEGTKFFVLMGGHYWDHIASPPSSEEGIRMAKAVLERHLGIPADQPCFAMARFAKDCIPQHHVGHWQRMDRASSELQYAFNGKVAVAGGSYTAIGVTSGIRAAYDLAMQITQSAQDHIGETGLGQFQDRVPDFWQVHRRKLHEMGRDIAPQATWFHNHFG
ncbi:protoporphyrinogen oxidase [Colletotrichum truncatum]|uniref:Protoporphyrinogen oxidase n=1 Tax=Colletotrichum truncatum TaxID=5467 RepID=A0ACC3Z3T8_COLTU|nr:protoporphyrinogen oxidase [Colletotrichum truncatum]KAF6795627.1 protoporphyrinogen oxidase [Colletotrichum truncatum]